MYLGARDSILHGRAIANSNRAFPIRQSSTSRRSMALSSDSDFHDSAVTERYEKIVD